MLKSSGGVDVLLASLSGSWSAPAAVGAAGSPSIMPARKLKFTLDSDVKLVQASFQVRYICECVVVTY